MLTIVWDSTFSLACSSAGFISGRFDIGSSCGRHALPFSIIAYYFRRLTLLLMFALSLSAKCALLASQHTAGVDYWRMSFLEASLCVYRCHGI